ncbi:pseudouridine synthase [Zavarzinia compransoris]|uniref:pseudouridine synthase n=1 Tax=Zavarzinia marina TaxID=2911065 RepID=UPI001F38BBA1|nr:pseudouridine synthase [Zavarzinia marina]MCF4164732.1 pseudouridine synthase [Zavarzinia marina]
MAEGERIAKYLARAGVCSRRDAERLIEDGKVTVDGTVLTTPAFKVTGSERIMVEGRLVGSPQKTRLWRFNKPRGLVVSHKDEQGRPTVFDLLKSAGLPRVISIGRLDLNSEGLLLVTNDGELARRLELPENAWVRRYRVRVAGEIKPERLEALKKGITIDGVRYGSIEVSVDRIGGLNAWLEVALTEGKNREIRKVMDHLGLSVNRLQRVNYGPFDLERLDPGDIAPIGPAVIEKIMKGEEIRYDKPAPKPKPDPAAAEKPRRAKPESARGRAAPEKPDGAKSGSRKSAAPKAGGQREDGPKPTGRKPAGAKSSGPKPPGAKPSGAKPVGSRPARPKTTGAKPGGPKGGRDAHRRRP